MSSREHFVVDERNGNNEDCIGSISSFGYFQLLFCFFFFTLF
jgi:hypothetical protein